MSADGLQKEFKSAGELSDFSPTPWRTTNDQRLTTSIQRHPYAHSLIQNHKRTQAEVDATTSLSGGCGWERYSALAEQDHERALLLQNVVGDLAMKYQYKQADSHPRKFNSHHSDAMALCR